MRGLNRWAGYRALNRPLTLMGVERRLFLLAATLGLAVWNATASLTAGALIFCGWYGAGWIAGRKDPAILSVIRAAARYPARLDPGMWAREPWHIDVRRPQGP